MEEINPLTVKELHDSWRKANEEKTTYWKENQNKWDDKVEATYRALDSLSEFLFYKWLSAKTGKSAHDLECETNSKIHSRYD